MRAVSPTFADVWSQPRLFFNSLLQAEQQMVVNAIRFETSQLKSSVVKNNVLIQLNRVSHDVAVRVASALGMTAPEADPTYYHDNKTVGVSVAKDQLLKIDGLKVGYLASSTATSSNSSLASIRTAFAGLNVDVVVVAESLADGANQTYSASDASSFDAIIVGDGTDALFASPSSLANANSTSGAPSGNASTNPMSTLYPAGRPLQILQDGYRWGKPVGVVGSSRVAFRAAGIQAGTLGVYAGSATEIVNNLKEGLKTFKFLDRFPVDQ